MEKAKVGANAAKDEYTPPMTREALEKVVDRHFLKMAIQEKTNNTQDEKEEFWQEAKAAIMTAVDAHREYVIGEDDEHKHMIRVYDEGCQRRDHRNKLRAEQRKRGE